MDDIELSLDARVFLFGMSCNLIFAAPSELTKRALLAVQELSDAGLISLEEIAGGCQLLLTGAGRSYPRHRLVPCGADVQTWLHEFGSWPIFKERRTHMGMKDYHKKQAAGLLEKAAQAEAAAAKKPTTSRDHKTLKVQAQDFRETAAIHERKAEQYDD